jgi:hypothetical protein
MIAKIEGISRVTVWLSQNPSPDFLKPPGAFEAHDPRNPDPPAFS